jgi:hypothetical protein
MDTQGIVWKRSKNLVWLPGKGKTTGTADASGNVSCLPLVPESATAAILTVECGYLQTPAQANAVQIRIMPFGFNLEKVLDIHKHTAYAGGVIPSIDVVAMQVMVPFHLYEENPELKFFYALQSTDSSITNKMLIIDVWGYTCSPLA